MCGGPMPGYRGGDLVLVDPDGRHRRVLHDGNCERYLDRTRWLTDDHLVAILHTRRDGTDPQPPYDSRVVLIDANRRMVSRPISMTDRVGHLSVSPGMKRIAYADWTAPTGFWVWTWRPTGGDPGQDEWAQGTTRRFATGRVPHLRGDSTEIPSY